MANAWLTLLQLEQFWLLTRMLFYYCPWSTVTNFWWNLMLLFSIKQNFQEINKSKIHITQILLLCSMKNNILISWRWGLTFKTSVLCWSPRVTLISCYLSWALIDFHAGEQTDRESANHHGRSVGDPTLQLQSRRREPVWHWLGVHQPHANVWVSSSSVSSRGTLSEPKLHQTPVHRGGDLQDAVAWLGFTRGVWHQEGGLYSLADLFERYNTHRAG